MRGNIISVVPSLMKCAKRLNLNGAREKIELKIYIYCLDTAAIKTKTLKTKIKYLFPILLFVACNRAPKDDETIPGPLFPQPQSIETNPEGGYVVNPVTGDTIRPIISSLGDTLKTGVPIPSAGRAIHPDSATKPKVFPLPPKDDFTKINAHPNVFKIPEGLTVIPVNHYSLTTIVLQDISEDDATHYILNSSGQKVKTGVNIPTKGKLVKTIQPQPVKALPLAIKVANVTDLKYLDVDQGMSSSYIWSILEDKKGNIWFGTSGGGASVYNGETFQHFTEKEGMSNNTVWSILEDKDGNLWFGTWNGGVSMYDGSSFRHFTEKEGLSNNTVLSIIEDKNGNLWFGTWGGGATMYDGKSFKHFTTNEGLSSDIVMSILEDRSGNLWFGTDGGGVTMYDGKSFFHFTEKEGLCNNTVLSILEDKNGNLWFGSSGGGVSMYDGKSFRNFSQKEGLSNNTVRSILEDKSGNLWFSTWGGGVSVYNGNSFTNFAELDGLSNNVVLSIFEDSGGNLWFGTHGGGASLYNGESFKNFTETEGLSQKAILCILEDKRGNLWFGTDGGGLSMYDGESFIHYTEKEGLSNNTVRVILEDKNGNLWFGTDGGGANMYDGESFIHYTEKEGLSNNRVWSMVEDRRGNLWFGTWGGGLTVYKGATSQGNDCTHDICKHDLNVQDDLEIHRGFLKQSFLHFTEKEGLSNNIVWSILEDKKGNLWIGTSGGGVCMYNGESFKHFTEKEGLSNNTVWSILEDKNGNLWFATYGGGVSMYSGETSKGNDCTHGVCNHDLQDNQDLEKHREFHRQSFLHFTEKEGLSNNTVWSILEDKNGNLYFSTEKGLTKIIVTEQELISTTQNKEDLVNKKFTVHTFDKQDGLRGLDFCQNSAFIDSKNRAWWGSGKCLTMLDLKTFQPSKKPPLVCLKQLDINEQFLDYNNISDSLEKEITFSGVQKFENYPLNLELPYDKNHLTFHFVGIDWNAPHKIKYSHRLLGLNEQWSSPSDEAKADYRNLSHGVFTLQISAIGESGEWSKPLEYTFTINPPWWHTWLARAGYAICAFVLILALFRWRTSKLRARQAQLEKDIEKATEEIRLKKEQVEEAHKEITDSINYAERLQRSLMASKKMLDENIGNYFVYFNPKEAVSGDFYWSTDLPHGSLALVCADSTGHGVPGAIMSMMNMNSLKEAVKEGHSSSDEILNQTRSIIIQTLANDGSAEGGKDGMDAALLIFNQEKTNLEYSLANSPLWIIRNHELLEFKPDKMPVGKHDKQHIPFTKNNIKLQKGDMLYVSTDGFADQFGGEKGKKFKSSSLKELLLTIADKSMEEQKMVLSKTFENWRRNLEQVDDVCVIGVRI